MCRVILSGSEGTAPLLPRVSDMKVLNACFKPAPEAGVELSHDSYEKTEVMTKQVSSLLLAVGIQHLI